MDETDGTETAVREDSSDASSAPERIYVGRTTVQVGEKPALRVMTTGLGNPAISRTQDLEDLPTLQSPLFKAADHFGPWTDARLNQVEVYVRQMSSIQWHWNDYFVGHPDHATYDEHVPGGAVPEGDYSPTINYSPGDFPANDGANDLLFRLHEVACTRRYGGSIRFRFRLSQDTGYELRKDQTVWDVRFLELLVYVNPDPQSLVSGPGLGSSVHLELNAVDVTAYELLSNNQVRASYDDRIEDLSALLKELAASFEAHGEQNFAVPARWFAHGWLHAHLRGELTGQDIVDSLMISDDFFDVRTHVGRPYFSVLLRVEGVGGHGFWGNQLGDWFADEEFVIRIRAQYYLDPDLVNLPAKACAISTGENTPWYQGPIGVLGETQVPPRLHIEIGFHERDPIFDIEEVTAEHVLDIDVDQLQERKDNGDWGIVTEVVQGEDSWAYLWGVDYSLRAKVMIWQA